LDSCITSPIFTSIAQGEGDLRLGRERDLWQAHPWIAKAAQGFDKCTTWFMCP